MQVAVERRHQLPKITRGVIRAWQIFKRARHRLPAAGQSGHELPVQRPFRLPPRQADASHGPQQQHERDGDDDAGSQGHGRELSPKHTIRATFGQIRKNSHDLREVGSWAFRALHAYTDGLQSRQVKPMKNRRTEPLRWVILALATTAPIGASAADPVASAAPQVSEIVVTARRLDEARATIQPQLGASVYTITSKAIDALPGGENTGLNQVILQAPGVAQDSFGQLHVRGEHNGLQYRLDGVILPEGLSVFGQALNPRLADKVELITGALPAQYGLRTAGIIDITTKSGDFDDVGSLSLYGGSHGEIGPSAEYSGSSGNFNYFFSASYLHDDLGVESPDPASNPLHDTTDQLQAFAYLADIIDPASRVSLILGASNERFQIPDLIDQTPSLMFGPQGDQPLVVDGRTTYPSDMLNESQKEATYYAVASYLHTTERFTGQLSLFGRYSTLKFTPDPLGDLLFDGISQDAYKRDVAGGFQAEGVVHVGEAHTVRAGLIGEIDRSTSDTSSQVIPLDPVTGSQTTDQPQAIVDDDGRTARSISAYVQDEWRLLDSLTVNYGLRFDQFDGFRDENQLSPRLNMVWEATSSTTAHAGYSRYFSPPPFELVGAETVAKFNSTTAASAVHHRHHALFGTRQLLRRRRIAAGRPRADPRRRQLLQDIEEPDRRRPVWCADHPDAIQLRARAAVRRRVQRQLQPGTVHRLRELRLRQEPGRGHHLQPVQLQRRRSRLYRQPLHLSGSRPDLHRVRGRLVSVARHTYRRRPHLRQRPALDRTRRYSQWRPPAGLRPGQSRPVTPVRKGPPGPSRSASGRDQPFRPRLRNPRRHRRRRRRPPIRPPARRLRRRHPVFLTSRLRTTAPSTPPRPCSDHPRTAKRPPPRLSYPAC